MEAMIAYCGLSCHTCPALLATKANDDAKRQEVARLWSKLYQVNIKPSEIHCHGCLSEGGELFHHCRVCGIRKCGGEKGLLNCAYCPEYACARLEEFFHLAPHARKKLDAIRLTKNEGGMR